MNSSWREAQFNKLCDITRGASPRPIQDYLSKEGMPWVKIADATNSVSRFIERTNECIKLDGVTKSKKVFPGDLILSNSATPGIPKFMKIEACIHDGWMLLRNFRGLDKKFAYWLLLHERSNLIMQGNGSIFTNLKTDILKNHIVKIPDEKVQKKIASVLDSLQSKIELNYHINQTLEFIAQAIFKSWFIDFEPVKAKIAVLEAGGTNNQAELAAMCTISGKDEATLTQLQQQQPKAYEELTKTAALFPSTMQESTLGTIPYGWKVGVLSQLIEFNPKRTLKKGSIAPYLDMKNVPIRGHLAEVVIEREMSSGTKFKNGDTLLARITPCLENGKTVFVDFLKEEQVGWGSTEYIVLRPRKEYHPSLGYFIARNDAFRSAAIQSMTGTSGRQRANASALADLSWLIYPKELIGIFAKVSESYLKTAKNNGEESKILTQIRDSLLPKLLSGEIELDMAGSRS